MNAADKPLTVSGPATGGGAPLVCSLQFLTVGPDSDYSVGQRKVHYGRCEMCGWQKPTAVIHGLNPESGQQHVDLCADCLLKLKLEGRVRYTIWARN